MDNLSVGDIITIPRDQHGNPVLAVDPKTKELVGGGQLQKFRVVEITENQARLEPIFRSEA